MCPTYAIKSNICQVFSEKDNIVYKLLIFWGKLVEMDKKTVGKVGEYVVERYLKKSGYSILEMNYVSKKGEVDLFVEKRSKLFAVEVKTNSITPEAYDGNTSMQPLERVDRKKLFRILLMTQEFIRNKKYNFDKYGVLFVSVKLDIENKRAKVECVEEIMN